jgi:hypothetical protein
MARNECAQKASLERDWPTAGSFSGAIAAVVRSTGAGNSVSKERNGAAPGAFRASALGKCTLLTKHRQIERRPTPWLQIQRAFKRS